MNSLFSESVEMAAKNKPNSEIDEGDIDECDDDRDSKYSDAEPEVLQMQSDEEDL